MCNEEINFSLWCDFVERSFLENEFEELIKNNVVNAATSNPAIFKAAFLGSVAYQKDKERLAQKSAKEVYEALAIQDISLAAQKLENLYKQGKDGFISIEVDPFLCDDAKGTIEEGRRLYSLIGKENVMIKVPATDAGYAAMEELMSEGINVNATLIFSPKQAQNVVEAFQRATIRFKDNYEGKKIPQGVVSVFVSRFDSKLDKLLKELNLPESKVGIYNAMKIYDLIESYNLTNVRTLFASTGVKRADLEADYYIKELLFKNSINTAPLATIKAFIQSKEMEEKTLTKEHEEFFELLEKNDIQMEKVYNELMNEGLDAFKEAFKEILNEL
ncbi:MAG TPA: transaldolase [Sulfurospirillum sp. UBA12182]|nr:MAG TPA: transaldolase [Sulfurospirillum sp. UBA12182]